MTMSKRIVLIQGHPDSAPQHLCDALQQAQEDIKWSEHLVLFFSALAGRYARIGKRLFGAGSAARLCL